MQRCRTWHRAPSRSVRCTDTNGRWRTYCLPRTTLVIVDVFQLEICFVLGRMIESFLPFKESCHGSETVLIREHKGYVFLQAVHGGPGFHLLSEINSIQKARGDCHPAKKLFLSARSFIVVDNIYAAIVVTKFLLLFKQQKS